MFITFDVLSTIALIHPSRILGRVGLELQLVGGPRWASGFASQAVARRQNITDVYSCLACKTQRTSLLKVEGYHNSRPI
jgi:hypothetical protein